MRFILSMLVVFTLGLGVLTACQDTAAPLKIEAIKTDTKPAPKADEHSSDDNAARIPLAEAKKDFDSGDAIFIDTRSAEAFKLERIKGSINIPLNDLEARINDIPKNKKIIAYCS